MSEHHRYGSEIVGDSELGGILNADNCLLLNEWTTLAVSTLSEGQALPAIALQLQARINHSGDTVDATYLLPVMEVGQLVGALMGAVMRLGDETAMNDLRVGVALGQEQP